MGISAPPITPGFAATCGAAGCGCGAGGVSEPFFVDFPNEESGTVFGSLLATGFGGSATGSGMASFFGAGAGGAMGATGATGVGAVTLAGFANWIFSVDISWGSVACMAA